MRHRTIVRSVLHIAICALTLAWIACGSDDSSSAPDATPADAGAASDADSAPPAPDAAPAATGDTVITEDALPDGFPSDVSVYPGATIGPAMAIPGLGVFATFESEDDVSDVLDHYRSSLADEGWSTSDLPDVGIDATKGDRSVEIRARATQAGKTEIAVNVNEG